MFNTKFLNVGFKATGAAFVGMLLLSSQAAVAEVQLGDPSVQSQRGQRLKIALPYSSNPGERVPVLRFTIDDVRVPEGFKAPSAKGFTMLQGESRNLVTLLSRETVDAPSMSMVVRVSNQTTDNNRSYVVNIPERSLANTEAPEAKATKPSKYKGKKKARTYKRKITAQNDLPPK